MNGYLDAVMGLQEGGTGGVGLLAAMKTAGINTAPYAPWVMGGSIATNTLGKFLGSAADAPYERQQYRLGGQQLEIGALNIQAEKARQEEERKQKAKRDAMQRVMSRVFSKYNTLSGGA
jgi:hypothetical protein